MDSPRLREVIQDDEPFQVPRTGNFAGQLTERVTPPTDDEKQAMEMRYRENVKQREGGEVRKKWNEAHQKVGRLYIQYKNFLEKFKPSLERRLEWEHDLLPELKRAFEEEQKLWHQYLESCRTSGIRPFPEEITGERTRSHTIDLVESQHKNILLLLKELVAEKPVRIDS